MAERQGPSGGAIPLAILLSTLGIGLLYVATAPLPTLRPSGKAALWSEERVPGRANARIWRDPLTPAMQQYDAWLAAPRQKNRSEGEICAEIEVNTIDELGDWIRAKSAQGQKGTPKDPGAGKPPPDLLLILPISGENFPWSEQTRADQRLAVLSAFCRAGFEPEDNSNIRYAVLWSPKDKDKDAQSDAATDAASNGASASGTPGELRGCAAPWASCRCAASLPVKPGRPKTPKRELTDVVVTPYDILKQTPRTSSTTAPTLAADPLGIRRYERAVVLWVRTDRLRARAGRFGAFDDILGQVEARTKLDGAFVKWAQQTDVVVLTSGSDGLRDLINKDIPALVGRANEADSVHLDHLEKFRGLRVLDYGSTLTPERVIEVAEPPQQLLGELLKPAFTVDWLLESETLGQVRTVSVERLIGHDGHLAKAMLCELERRGIDLEDPSNVVAILHEWDTEYGRGVMQAFHGALKSLTTTKVPLATAKAPLTLREYAFPRQLDGRLPISEAGAADVLPAPSGGSAREGGDAAAYSQELPIGRAMFDYVRRLGKRIRTDAEDERIVAVGVVGDRYDKLAIIQALREAMPDTLLFTTDAEAIVAHPSVLPHYKNVLVASHYGLELGRGLQGPIPPFRTNYGTSQFLATLVALAGPDRTQESDGENGILPKGWECAWKSDARSAPDPMIARVYEVSRFGLVDLSVRTAEQTLHAPSDVDVRLAPWWVFLAIGPVIAGVIALSFFTLVALDVNTGARETDPQVSRALGLIASVACAIVVIVAAGLVGAAGTGAPPGRATTVLLLLSSPGAMAALATFAAWHMLRGFGPRRESRTPAAEAGEPLAEASTEQPARTAPAARGETGLGAGWLRTTMFCLVIVLAPIIPFALERWSLSCLLATDGGPGRLTLLVVLVALFAGVIVGAMALRLTGGGAKPDDLFIAQPRVRRTLLVASMFAVLTVRGAYVLSMSQDEEPIFFRAGVSAWPSVALLWGVLVVGAIAIVLHVVDSEDTRRKTRERFEVVRPSDPASPSLKSWGQRAWEQWRSGASSWLLRFNSSDCGESATLEYDRLLRVPARARRVALMMLALLPAALLVFCAPLFDLPTSIRGGLSRFSFGFVSTLAGVAIALMSALVWDEVHTFGRYAKRLLELSKTDEMVWDERAHAWASTRWALTGRAADAVVTVAVLANLSRVMTPMLYMPFGLLVCNVLARSGFFDAGLLDWPAVALLGGLGLVGLVTAEHARTIAKRVRVDLTASLQSLEARETDPASASLPPGRRAVPQAKAALAALETIRHGVFSPLVENPVIRASLIPVGGFGIYQLADAVRGFI